MAIHYQDSKIVCDEDGLTIRHYYFPFGWSKRVLYTDIRRVEVYKVGWLTGKGRVWGGSPWFWLNLDWHRSRKKWLIVLDVGTLTKPCITPDDAEAVLKILKDKTGRAAVRHAE